MISRKDMFSMLAAAAALVAGASCGTAQQPQPKAKAQAQREGGAPARPALRAVPACEGCEAAWERDPATLSAAIRLAPEGEPGEPMVLRGTVYRPDGRTPAAGIVLYVHQTDAAGLYSRGTAESEWSRRHGLLRGWLRTGADGRYEVLTVKPGRYPDGREPAHVHITVLEPGKDPDWVDDVVFAGEPGVDDRYRSRQRSRGGPGILTLRRDEAGRWLAERDIVLER